MSIAVAHGHPFSIDDLDQFPDDDGLRYELIEGTLIVRPSPTSLHQRAVTRILLLLHAACPPELEVLPGPVDVVLGPTTMVAPDAVLARTVDMDGKRFEDALPLLVIEVISPSSRLMDPNTKRAAYESSGVEGYWIVDPVEPSVRVVRWIGEGGTDEQFVSGDDTLTLDWPVAVELCPARLVSDER